MLRVGLRARLVSVVRCSPLSCRTAGRSTLPDFGAHGVQPHGALLATSYRHFIDRVAKQDEFMPFIQGLDAEGLIGHVNDKEILEGSKADATRIAHALLALNSILTVEPIADGEKGSSLRAAVNEFLDRVESSDGGKAETETSEILAALRIKAV